MQLVHSTSLNDVPQNADVALQLLPGKLDKRDLSGMFRRGQFGSSFRIDWETIGTAIHFRIYVRNKAGGLTRFADGRSIAISSELKGVAGTTGSILTRKATAELVRSARAECLEKLDSEIIDAVAGAVIKLPLQRFAYTRERVKETEELRYRTGFLLGRPESTATGLKFRVPYHSRLKKSLTGVVRITTMIPTTGPSRDDQFLDGGFSFQAFAIPSGSRGEIVFGVPAEEMPNTDIQSQIAAVRKGLGDFVYVVVDEVHVDIRDE